MKKFVGTVNGVEYTNREDFNKAATEAMLNNDGTLCISSYETIVPDEEVNVIPQNVKVILDNDDFVLTRKSEKAISEDGEVYFHISDKLKEQLVRCENRNDVENAIRQELAIWQRTLGLDNKFLHKDENELNELMDKINRIKENIKKDEGGVRYYKELLNILNDEETVNEDETKENDNVKRICKCNNTCTCKKENKSDVDELVETISGFGKFLKSVGFFK